jgi:ankyrin repeat protein
MTATRQKQDEQRTAALDRRASILIAAEDGDLESVRTLLDADDALVRAHDLGREWTPLHRAARNGHAEIAELLLGRGAEIHARERGDEATPLHLAARGGHAEATRVLLRHGADPELRTRSGKRPLCLALEWGRGDVARLLLTENRENALAAARSVRFVDSALALTNLDPGIVRPEVWYRLTRFW